MSDQLLLALLEGIRAMLARRAERQAEPSRRRRRLRVVRRDDAA